MHRRRCSCYSWIALLLDSAFTPKKVRASISLFLVDSTRFHAPGNSSVLSTAETSSMFSTIVLHCTQSAYLEARKSLTTIKSYLRLSALLINLRGFTLKSCQTSLAISVSKRTHQFLSRTLAPSSLHPIVAGRLMQYPRSSRKSISPSKLGKLWPFDFSANRYVLPTRSH